MEACRKEEYVLLGPRLGSDVSVLAAQVTGLACLRLRGVADGHLAALVRVEMGAGASAVAIGGNGLLVDVVHEGTTGGGEARKGNGEADAFAISARDGGNGTTEGAAGFLRQSAHVAGT